ncbi:MAG: PTS sugar transporter subunit IIA [Planctomycetes bacterium]|nr:PTS sugar transporter subunit IIA [Planctomycetota bacterium]
MELVDALTTKTIVTKLDVADKWDLLEKMTDLFERSGSLEGQPVTRADVIKSLIAREEAQSTGLGEGLAIPHARLHGFKGMAIALASLKTPIHFEALDDKPVSLVWAILFPEDEPTIALQAYAKVQELMQDDAIRSYFCSVDDPEKIYQYIAQRRISVGDCLTARDIMRSPSTKILPDMPLRDVVRQMRKHSTEAVPVEDENRRILGEITCDRLFQFGMPDFFNQLQSVQFISRFDPFERYFSEEAKATASDVMESSYAVVPPDATMLEVVFSLTVQNHLKVYVVEEGIRIGTIDRTEVLDRILDF